MLDYLIFIRDVLEGYGEFTVCLLAAGTFAAAWKGGWRGMLAAHVIVALIVSMLDVAWVEAERQRSPEGGADLDMLFSFGVILRVLLINIILLPAALFGLWWRHKFETRSGKSAESTEG